MIQCTANTWGQAKGFGLKMGLKIGLFRAPNRGPRALLGALYWSSTTPIHGAIARDLASKGASKGAI